MILMQGHFTKVKVTVYAYSQIKFLSQSLIIFCMDFDDTSNTLIKGQFAKMSRSEYYWCQKLYLSSISFYAALDPDKISCK